VIQEFRVLPSLLQIRKVVGQLNEKLAKLEKRSAQGEQSIAQERDMSHVSAPCQRLLRLKPHKILDSFCRVMEHTVTDVAESIDGTDDEAVQCAICLEPMKLQECASYVPSQHLLLLTRARLNCGHFFHTTCTLELVQDSRIPCPHCRKPTKRREVLQKLYNFDAGWEQLVQLADKWKRMCGDDDLVHPIESEEESVFPSLLAVLIVRKGPSLTRSTSTRPRWPSRTTPLPTTWLPTTKSSLTGRHPPPRRPPPSPKKRTRPLPHRQTGPAPNLRRSSGASGWRSWRGSGLASGVCE
jgi:hypothetical protein